MHAATLKHQFQFCDFVLRKNLDGISNEDALVAPAPGGNCINRCSDTSCTRATPSCPAWE